MNHVGIMGGAGFIGRHFVAELLRQDKTVSVFDNFCSGTPEHLAEFDQNPKLRIHRVDIEDTEKLIELSKNIDAVIHLASNPDIAKAASEPRIDFVQGTVLTESVAEVCRLNRVPTILYASGSGVYGDKGETILNENSPLSPISTYGASKLAGEALLESYSYMFGMRCLAFRFANVVGPFQTHGVGYDFLRRLKSDPTRLMILGNGLQKKSYVYVTDIVNGVLLAEKKHTTGFDVFNISTPDSITVNEIATSAMEALEIDPSDVAITYSGGDRGWKADVPVVRLSAHKLLSLGWNPQFNSVESIRQSLRAMNSQLEV